MQNRSQLDSTVLSSKKANLVCNSIAACVDHTRKSNYEVPDGQTSCEKALIHEHDLSVCVAENKNYIVRCLTCNVCFCGLCGKALNYPQILQMDLKRENKKKDNSKERENRVKTTL
ncbi:MAG: hypothetical protein WBZ36_28410 [Candidatus Nitrosopolaris sp.]